MTNNIILVIVESPSKCKKIQDFLTQIDKTKQFIVCASCGHFREIASIDDNTFAITFSYIRGKKICRWNSQENEKKHGNHSCYR